MSVALVGAVDKKPQYSSCSEGKGKAVASGFTSVSEKDTVSHVSMLPRWTHHKHTHTQVNTDRLLQVKANVVSLM